MFHELTVRDVRPEGRDAVAISFDMPEGLRDAFTYQPGQYLTLRAEVDGVDLRRSYSIASCAGEPLTVGVKHVPGGVFSGYAQGLTAGDTVQVMPPQGRFTDPGYGRLVLVAAGSGITPMVSLTAAALDRGAEVALIYGNRSRDTIMFLETLEALKDRHMGRLSLIHVLSREAQDVPLLNGRVTGDMVRRLDRAGAVDVAGADGVFLCGPGGMIDDVEAALGALGLPGDRIHHERFFVGGTPARKMRSDAARKVVADGVAVDVALDGAMRSFTVGAGDDTILEAAEREGIELPYSCRGGMCCTCRCRVIDGAVEMAVNYSLEPWEIEAGFVLACQARPATKRVVLDFDAV